MKEHDDTPSKQSSIKMQAAWRPGDRTPAWDALWRQIIADVEETLDRSSSDGEAEDSGPTVPPAAPSTGEV